MCEAFGRQLHPAGCFCVLGEGILMFVCNQWAKSHEILMFVSLQKDAKRCCDATKSMALIVLVVDFVSDQHNEHSELCGITALFGVFLETNKHQNLTKLIVAEVSWVLWRSVEPSGGS